MDLGHCPKCGEAWVVGDERCRHCGYVAIGAGLARLPKRKRKKVKKYVEPGSATPLLSFTLVSMLFGGAFMYKPWDNDWDLVRACLGQPRHHSLQGDWDVVETLHGYNASIGVFADEQVSSGEIRFDGSGNVEMRISNAYGELGARGQYVVTGEHVAILNIKPDRNYSTKIPAKLSLDLGWTGPDAFVASIGQGDTLYVRRAGIGSGDETEHRTLTATEDGSKDIGGTMSQSKDGG